MKRKEKRRVKANPTSTPQQHGVKYDDDTYVIQSIGDSHDMHKRVIYIKTHKIYLVPNCQRNGQWTPIVIMIQQYEVRSKYVQTKLSIQLHPVENTGVVLTLLLLMLLHVPS